MSRSWIMLAASAVAACLMFSPSSHSSDAAQSATVTVNFNKSRGPFIQPQRYNNFSRWTSWTGQRDEDIRFLNEQGLHGKIYKVWVDAERIHDPETDTYSYDGLDDYLADASLVSDELLMVMDTRVSVRDMGRSPSDIKPIIKQIMTDLKKRFPQIRYVEAFNEPDHNLAKNITPSELYDYYIVYYQAVNEINRELQPNVPLEIGGPGYMQYNPIWMDAFLDRYVADQSADKRLDFLSWHAYGEFPPGTGDKNGPRAYHFYKGDPSEVANQRERLDRALRDRKLSTDVPVFITETGIYPGPSFDTKDDPTQDYLTGAAGVHALHYWYMEQENVYPFHWVVRHRTEERKDQLVTRSMGGKHIAVKGGDGVEGLPINIFTPYGNAMKMQSLLKTERVKSESSALINGKGVYSIATKDEYGVAIMIWNYQHIDQNTFDTTIQLKNLPKSLRGREVVQKTYRIDDQISNYWANPETANLQMISESVVTLDRHDSVGARLSPNALQLIVLEPVD